MTAASVSIDWTVALAWLIGRVKRVKALQAIVAKKTIPIKSE
jgi:hypothetical protein